ncbi:hypothetical protein C7974DRAFT_120715 [Boeremia exigua]|uniref:uncharacterized protein n=1 Tax=Boeremia exigua TaxID=749465 RepID=UPI001E8DE38A|nr:uncharacterized protein C7974DRAFT_120715 [Boeremia exigua]KAH6638749.1 hypothetical protein C7974DRAFT_120715 [Boeremia exigua]
MRLTDGAGVRTGSFTVAVRVTWSSTDGRGGVRPPADTPALSGGSDRSERIRARGGAGARPVSLWAVLWGERAGAMPVLRGMTWWERRGRLSTPQVPGGVDRTDITVFARRSVVLRVFGVAGGGSGVVDVALAVMMTGRRSCGWVVGISRVVGLGGVGLSVGELVESWTNGCQFRLSPSLPLTISRAVLAGMRDQT